MPVPAIVPVGSIDPAADVFNNLHGKVGKTAVTKALTTLVEKGEISGKAYGKQWVYVARQDTLPAPSPEELDRLDSEIEGLKASVAEQREATRTVQTGFPHFERSHWALSCRAEQPDEQHDE